MASDEAMTDREPPDQRVINVFLPRRVIGAARDQEIAERACNCKRSNCLKLYCECFANGMICQPRCRCQSCYNNPAGEKLRATAVEQTLEKNPVAFRPKIVA
ncbi:unnamed protein product, partial [Phaeothamnion confervicola]